MRSFSTLRKLLVVAALTFAPLASFAGIFISVGFAPPVLPVYTQPLCPGDGYLWTPGYWAYGPEGYFWVPGVWVEPPTVGYLWTPPYWGFEGGSYLFHEGYWGPQVGFYGGVNYGFGFFGNGYYGGRWEGNRFAYNRAVNNINIVNVHNVYEDRNVFRQVNVNNRISYNGGPNGIQARPSGQQLAFERERHIPPTANQQSHFQTAEQNRANFASANGGHPAVAAMPRIGANQGAVPSRGFEAERANNQQQRIANGISNGQMTPREAGRIDNREGNINQTARQDRQVNGGALTPDQRQNLNQRQDNTSRTIYQDNHNNATQPTTRNGFGSNQQPYQGQQPNQIQQRTPQQAQPSDPRLQQPLQQRNPQQQFDQRPQQQQFEQRQQQMQQQRAQQQQQFDQRQQQMQQRQQQQQPQFQRTPQPQSEMRRPIEAQPRAEAPRQQPAPRGEGVGGGEHRPR